MKNLYLIDASGYLYRSYFAIQQMTNAKGESTNALFGFIRSILKLLKDFEPTHIAAIFDGPNNAASRIALYSDYKAHRKKMPPDLAYQIGFAKTFCSLMGISQIAAPNVEADDTMGSIALWAAKQKTKVYLCTSDKDLCQLVNDYVFILNTFKDNRILGPKEVVEEFGVPPEQIIDFLAITGDASDNVPGISGFGPKTAAQLLHQFGSLEAILAAPEKVAGKKKQETLALEKEKALLSQKLVTIDSTVPFTQENEFFKKGPVEETELRSFYSAMNFSSLLKELEHSHPRLPKESEQENLVYTLVNDSEALFKLANFLAGQREICIDTETSDIHPLKAQLVGIGVGTLPKQAWYIPTNGALKPETIREALKPIFENPHICFYGHNLKFDLHVLENFGLAIANPYFDTMIASYLLNSHSRQHSLDALSLNLFGKTKIAIEELIGKGKAQKNMKDVDIEKVCIYCCEDVDYTMRLKRLFVDQIETRGLHHLFYAIEMPLLTVLAKMERRGIFIDLPSLNTLGIQLNREIKLLEKEIHALAGESFNLNSPKQLSEILFTKMGIHPPKKTATGHSTNAEVLESLKAEFPICAKLLEYRSLEKLRSTYVEALPEEVNPRTHRIHCTFNQSMTATGRLSCHDPNLQNIPVRTAMGRNIREAFRPEESNWSFLSADYSQIELRILAHLSEDPTLMRAFQEGEDVHSFTASQIFNVPLSEVSAEERHQAKAVNFGIMYGQQAFGLSQELQIDPKTAALFIQKYFERYHKVKELIENNKKQAKETGKAVTLLGRERLIPEIHSSNGTIRAAAERLAINTPIQGSQADLIKMAMIEIDKRLTAANLSAFMILQIHDELIFEVLDSDLEKTKNIVQEVMTNIIHLKVPLVVDIHIGKNWKEC